jgi:hypothetical protein
VNGMVEGVGASVSLLTATPLSRLLDQSHQVDTDDDFVKVIAATTTELAKKDATTTSLQRTMFGGVQRVIRIVDPAGAAQAPNYSQPDGQTGSALSRCGQLAGVALLANVHGAPFPDGVGYLRVERFDVRFSRCVELVMAFGWFSPPLDGSSQAAVQ